MELVYASLIGYALGCINPCFLIGKLKGIDVREFGSKNPGASNAKILFGWKYFFIVFLYDSTKAMISMFIAKALFPLNHQAFTLAGVAAIIGHMFPFYLKFKGGKGAASSVGFILALDWKAGLIALAISVGVSLIFNWIVLMTYTLAIFNPLYCYLNFPKEIYALIGLLFISFFMFKKHMVNIKKLINKKEIGINGNYVGTKIKAEIDK